MAYNSTGHGVNYAERDCQVEHERLAAAVAAAIGAGASGMPTHIGTSSQVSNFEPPNHIGKH